jgi:ATP-binding cassette, subfamily C (CFTR/MRP), member 1
MMSVQRVTELTDIDSDKTTGIPRMARELDEPGQALQSEFLTSPGHEKLNVSLAPVNEAALVADGWPWMGGVRFRDVSMRYNPSSPLVLKKVSLSIPPGTTLGVVGRTGSGKSSLLLTLFRIIEIENGGSIEIDGVDIRAVSIQTLREKLSIIPQDPVLFTGTIAYNLDATGKTSADEMWQALEAMSPEMAAQFRQSGKGLETPINEGGGNMSLGQRQLICLARALLRKSKILVLDEATSSVDSGTDQQVQATIRTQFVDKGVTVITVAHRLDTVLGYDRIAVLGDGEVLEFGSPSDLLKIENGELRRLLDADRLNKKKGGKTRQSPSLVVG